MALEPKPVERVDSSLLGYWYGIVKDGSDYFGIEALDVQQKSDSTYSITRYGKAIKGDMILPDTSYFTGYTSYIDNQRFMNIESFVMEEVITKRGRKPEWKKQRVYYIAGIGLHHDTLQVKTVTDNFSEQKVFRQPTELKQMIIKMAREKHSIYDDQYSLSYRKIERPQSLKSL